MEYSSKAEAGCAFNQSGKAPAAIAAIPRVIVVRKPIGPPCDERSGADLALDVVDLLTFDDDGLVLVTMAPAARYGRSHMALTDMCERAVRGLDRKGRVPAHECRVTRFGAV